MSKNKQAPYIGIIGFRSSFLPESLYKFWQNQDKRDLPLLLQIGVIMSHRTLHDRQSPLYELCPLTPGLTFDALGNGHGVLRTLRYIDDRSGAEGDLASSIEKGIEVCNKRLDAVQIEMKRPDYSALTQIRKRHPSLRLILHLSDTMLGRGWASVEKKRLRAAIKEAFSWLEAYDGVLDDVLLDWHQNDSKPPIEMCLDALQNHHPSLDITLGNMSPESVWHVEALIGKCPKLSIQAGDEVRVWGPGSELDRERSRDFLDRAVSVYRRTLNSRAPVHR